MTRRLLAVWIGLDALYLGSGILALVFALLVRMQGGLGGAPNSQTLRRLVISDMDLNAGVALGVITLTSWLLGVYGILSSRKISKTCTRGLTWFNWSVVASTVSTIAIGCMVWFFTLRPRNAFAGVWVKQPVAYQLFLQNSLQCCGYWDATPAGLFAVTTGFCANVAAGTNTTAVQPCVTPVGRYADVTLNNIFSTTFGFAAIQVSLVLITCCVIRTQMEEYRFSIIDAKRGHKGGFV